MSVVFELLFFFFYMYDIRCFFFFYMYDIKCFRIGFIFMLFCIKYVKNNLIYCFYIQINYENSLDGVKFLRIYCIIELGIFYFVSRIFECISNGLVFIKCMFMFLLNFVLLQVFVNCIYDLYGR